MIKLKDATNQEVVATWNVLQFSLRMICDKSDLQAKIDEVAAELERRGISFEAGKKIVAI